MSESTTQQLQMDLESLEDNTAAVEGELSAEQVDKAFQKVFNHLSKRIDVDGFRSGKVPPQVIVNRIGEGPIQRQVTENLRHYLRDKAIERFELNFRPGPDVECTPHSALERGEPFSFRLEIPVYPEFELPEYEEVELEVPVAEADEERREEYLEGLRERFQELNEKQDGAAEMGDVISGALKSEFIDGEEGSEDPPFQHDDIQYKLGAEPELTGFADELVGLEPGDTREFDYTVPEDYPHDEALQGRELHVTAECEQVFDVYLPELDEEFIQNQLGMESKQEFDEQIDQLVNNQVEEENKQVKFEAATDWILDRVDIDISDAWLDSEVENELASQRKRLEEEEGVTLDEWLEAQSLDREQYREELTEEIDDRLRFQLVVRAIAEENGLEPTEQELSMSLYRYMSENNIPSDKADELAENDWLMGRLNYELLRTKVREHLLNRFEFTEVEEAEVDTEPESEAGGEESDEAPVEQQEAE